MPINFPTRPVLFALAAAAPLIATSLPAAAQDYGAPYYDQSGATEEVIVTAPRYRHHERTAIGAPIENVSLASEVRYDDLDLRTGWGARALRSRVRFAAQDLCRSLDRRFPIDAVNSPDCYRLAYDRAMDQADAAIDRARNYAYRH